MSILIVVNHFMEIYTTCCEGLRERSIIHISLHSCAALCSLFLRLLELTFLLWKIKKELWWLTDTFGNVSIKEKKDSVFFFFLSFPIYLWKSYFSFFLKQTNKIPKHHLSLGNDYLKLHITLLLINAKWEKNLSQHSND